MRHSQWSQTAGGECHITATSLDGFRPGMFVACHNLSPHISCHPLQHMLYYEVVTLLYVTSNLKANPYYTVAVVYRVPQPV